MEGGRGGALEETAGESTHVILGFLGLYVGEEGLKVVKLETSE